MKTTEWPPLSKKLADWQMPNAKLQVCSAFANFWLGTIDQCLHDLDKGIFKYWKALETQQVLLRPIVRLFYCTDMIGYCAVSNDDFKGFFDFPPEIIRYKIEKATADKLRSMMHTVGQEGRELMYNTAIIRPEYLLPSDDEMRPKPQILQDSVDSHFKRLKSSVGEFRKELSLLEA